MLKSITRRLLLSAILFQTFFLFAADGIPEAAFKLGMGVPPANPGGKKPNLTTMIDDGYWQGAPVGGFGAGTFSRTYRGDFARWHMKTGVHKYQTLWTNQFSMYQKSASGEAFAQVLTVGKPDGPVGASWNWNYPAGAGDYYALYPKSWYDYKNPKFPAHLVIEQFSPILPKNYKETSYPIAVYQLKADNPSKEPVTVSVMLTWQNMIGWFRDFGRKFDGKLDEGTVNTFKSEPVAGGTMKGIVFDRYRHAGQKVTEDWDGQMTIAAVESPGVEVTHYATFMPGPADAAVWQPFAQTGKLPNSDQNWTSSGETLAGAIAVTFTLKPGENRVVPVVISWDMPVVQFGSGRKWIRKYTDFFGTTGTNAWQIAKTGLTNAQTWSQAIDKWQATIANDNSKPLWYRGMLFNELYNVADLGGFWARPPEAKPGTQYTFAFLECFDYPFYNTLDVLFYGSMPLAHMWPEISKSIMRDFAATVNQDLTQDFMWIWKSEQTGSLHLRDRKLRGAVPHDLGAPAEDPFAFVNQFSWQNTNRWKDLNPKFVLMIYRDYVRSGGTDTKFLRDTWPAVQQAMQHLRQFDTNNDGLPENEGYPDQTYDVWVVHGESAYCGSLYLASLRASEEIAKKLGDAKAAAGYRELFMKAQKSYIDKLWAGDYFRYDTGSEYKDNIQAEQLAGQWYANLTGLGDIVPANMRKSALTKVFNNNVMKFGDGKMGASNGIGADGTIIKTNEQVQEVWIGTTFGLASHMLSEGMTEEAYKTAWGVYNVVYLDKAYWFRTPEAYEIDGNYRASMYMRPGSIWAMEMVQAPKK
jgi:non-lysosomal glucosylceramidase